MLHVHGILLTFIIVARLRKVSTDYCRFYLTMTISGVLRNELLISNEKRIEIEFLGEAVGWWSLRRSRTEFFKIFKGKDRQKNGFWVILKDKNGDLFKKTSKNKHLL